MTVPACLILRSLSYTSLEYTLYALNCWNVGYKVVKYDAKKLPGLRDTSELSFEVFASYFSKVQ